jgi:hypothetical protein
MLGISLLLAIAKLDRRQSIFLMDEVGLLFDADQMQACRVVHGRDSVLCFCRVVTFASLLPSFLFFACALSLGSPLLLVKPPDLPSTRKMDAALGMLDHSCRALVYTALQRVLFDAFLTSHFGACCHVGPRADEQNSLVVANFVHDLFLDKQVIMISHQEASLCKTDRVIRMHKKKERSTVREWRDLTEQE